jgi:hypothetical protein
VERKKRVELVQEQLQAMSRYFYMRWYNEDVAPYLTDEQKDAVMRRISAMTLKEPIWEDRETNWIEQFPELKPYSHSGRIDGLQLCTVMEGCLKDLTAQR